MLRELDSNLLLLLHHPLSVFLHLLSLLLHGSFFSLSQLLLSVKQQQDKHVIECYVITAHINRSWVSWEWGKRRLVPGSPVEIMAYTATCWPLSESTLLYLLHMHSWHITWAPPLPPRQHQTHPPRHLRPPASCPFPPAQPVQNE